VSVFARLRRRRCRHQQAAIADAQSPDRKTLSIAAGGLGGLGWARRLAASATSWRFSRGGSPQAGKIPFAACAADQPYLRLIQRDGVHMHGMGEDERQEAHAKIQRFALEKRRPPKIGAFANPDVLCAHPAAQDRRLKTANPTRPPRDCCNWPV